ncbi:unnamed protein product, partial [Amoebophrya sp. A25]
KKGAAPDQKDKVGKVSGDNIEDIAEALEKIIFSSTTDEELSAEDADRLIGGLIQAGAAEEISQEKSLLVWGDHEDEGGKDGKDQGSSSAPGEVDDSSANLVLHGRVFSRTGFLGPVVDVMNSRSASAVHSLSALVDKDPQLNVTWFGGMRLGDDDKNDEDRYGKAAEDRHNQTWHAGDPITDDTGRDMKGEDFEQYLEREAAKQTHAVSYLGGSSLLDHSELEESIHEAERLLIDTRLNTEYNTFRLLATDTAILIWTREWFVV